MGVNGSLWKLTSRWLVELTDECSAVVVSSVNSR